jgi:selenide,water dikinase
LLAGLDKADDAAVYLINPDQAIVQTVDFFAPLVDDPYTYGAIAAANALNDVYAMGAEVLLALNIAAFPEDLPTEIVAAILVGGADKVREAGGVIAGGHTIIDEEPKFGLAATGIVHPSQLRLNSEAQPGDALVLTKRIGTGVLLDAIQGLSAEPEHEAAVVAQMSALNRAAAEVSRNFDVHALTDITGFGLAGHSFEIAQNSRTQIVLSLASVPMVAGLAGYVAQGAQTGGQSRNLAYFAKQLDSHELTKLESTLLFDPQTCGGLLITLPEMDVEPLQAQLRDVEVESWRVGSVEPVSDLGPRVRVIE